MNTIVKVVVLTAVIAGGYLIYRHLRPGTEPTPGRVPTAEHTGRPPLQATL